MSVCFLKDGDVETFNSKQKLFQLRTDGTEGKNIFLFILGLYI